MLFCEGDLRLEIFESVYEPEEDSYLLANSIPHYGKTVLDMGCGSGIQSFYAAKKANKVVGADINPKAVECAKHNAKLNKIGNTEFIESDLFENIEGVFDTIIFNTPYLAVNDKGLTAKAWTGGVDGNKVIKEFIIEVGDHLKKKGRGYMLISDANDLKIILDCLSNQGLIGEKIASKKVFFEELIVISFY